LGTIVLLGWLVGNRRLIQIGQMPSFTPGSGLALAAGIFLAALLAAIVHLARESRIRTQLVKETNRKLEDEIGERRLAEEKTRLILELSQSAFISIDAQSRITNWNRQAEVIFGRRREEALGRQLTDTIIPTTHRENHLRGLERFLATGEGPVLNRLIEMTAVHQDGHKFPIEMTICPLSWMGTYTFNAFITDITERKRAQETLENLAVRDELTGLYNRRGFLAMAQDRLNLAAREKKPLVIFFADVDGLKKINDTLGHDAGDAKLATATEVLRDAFRASDVIGHIGGDEFAVLATVKSLDALPIIEDRLRTRIAAQNPSGEAAIPFSISFGHTVLDPNARETLDDSLKKADKAMYAERQRSREIPTSER
jgi:diguanylate cyclase (GGDEF)-like protein/PAS domain S-box-containing protein